MCVLLRCHLYLLANQLVGTSAHSMFLSVCVIIMSGLFSGSVMC